MQTVNYEENWNIKTADIQMGIHRSYTYHRYEPTPYEALDAFFEKYKVTLQDHFIDFGCGKGRLNFYVANQFGAKATGIEMNELFYKDSLMNLADYRGKYKEKIAFEHVMAEDFDIMLSANRFYFFNPFTVDIFRSVINNILLSVEKVNRPVNIILYYPAPDYVYFLEEHPMFSYKLEVPLEGYNKNANERFLVYELAF
ncbi:class I SAM-dependent methyltransferase [Sutcliffiella rhizosphaerae]|uniref:DOT1 domain-containing protein n=1 Tax=Sutcliffiella rhizosphaerae TaxID=2880967 RepID=A0ABM8YJZ0_9BACI|nr:class I SAM-dependent methyltransferase [Sutcliffiella rhizosphaerae]CAG9620227.1 hypothetical protein BACCIP111883_00995 [Sutcliffiella rhizosphaerae]